MTDRNQSDPAFVPSCFPGRQRTLRGGSLVRSWGGGKPEERKAGKDLFTILRDAVLIEASRFLERGQDLLQRHQDLLLRLFGVLAFLLARELSTEERCVRHGRTDRHHRGPDQLSRRRHREDVA